MKCPKACLQRFENCFGGADMIGDLLRFPGGVGSTVEIDSRGSKGFEKTTDA